MCFDGDVGGAGSSAIGLDGCYMECQEADPIQAGVQRTRLRENLSLAREQLRS